MEQQNEKKSISIMPPSPLPNLPINARLAQKYNFKPDERQIIGQSIYNSGKSSHEKGVLYREHLSNHLNDILEMVCNAIPFRIISEFYGVPLVVFFEWRMLPEHSGKIETALMYSSEVSSMMALEVLEEDVDGDMAQANIQREKSQFHRWLASKRMPKVFGNKVEETLTIDTSDIKDKSEFSKLLEAIRDKRMVDINIPDKVKVNDKNNISDVEYVDIPTE